VGAFVGIGVAGLVVLAASVVTWPPLAAALARAERPPWATAAGAGALLAVFGFVGALVLDRTGDLGTAAASGFGAGLLVAAAAGALGRRR